MHVAIVGLGPSSAVYVDICKRLGDRRKYCDQTWVINAFGAVLVHDLLFHMDDVRVQMIRAQAEPQSNIAAMVQWLRTHVGPVVTSIAHPDFPALIEFPLEDMVNEGRAAVAFSLHPVTVDELMAIADANEIMPPKSTWFEPKLRDGLLSHLI